MTAPDPRRFLEPPHDRSEIERDWQAIERRLSRENPLISGWWWAGLAPVAAAAALALVALRSPVPPLARGLGAPSPTAAPVTRFADGSLALVSPGGQLSTAVDEPSRVQSELISGSAAFAVTHAPERPFVVVTRGVKVEVIGTRFQVDSSPERVAVSVSEGVVRVTSPRRPVGVKLLAGERFEELAGDLRGAAEAADATPEVGAATGPGTPPDKPKPSAAELLAAANAARRAGDTSRAKALYAELVRAYPDDPRAKLAALELGRLGVATGSAGSVAEESLKSAASSEAGSNQPGGHVQEDALANLVRLYHQKRDYASCARERDRYLASYPQGVHRGALMHLCKPPDQTAPK